VGEVLNAGSHELEFGIGYGLVYGRAESKAIAMSVLDFCLSIGDSAFPTQDQEFVLYHIDGVEATGFISHLKLPHYVTFQSKLGSARRTHGSDTVNGAHEAASAGANHASAL
jgi:alpha-D-ribose 1-methylphosphonate 5-triphosphate synthase subunit PhnI